MGTPRAAPISLIVETLALYWFVRLKESNHSYIERYATDYAFDAKNNAAA